mgnify:CR=1 FL=1
MALPKLNNATYELTLPSTGELPSETDVIIVGSGYTGSATAYWIHKVSDAVLNPSDEAKTNL